MGLSGDKDTDESIPPLEMNISVLISLGYEQELALMSIV